MWTTVFSPFATVEEAVALIENAKKMCKSGGFNLHKFISNHKDVIKSIQESDRGRVKELDLDSGTLPLERTLGSAMVHRVRLFPV